MTDTHLEELREDRARSRRRLVVAVASLLALAVAVGAPAAAGAQKKKKRVERVEEAAYAGALGPRGAADVPCVQEPAGCVRFPVEPGERFVTVEVSDAAGMPVWASVYINGYSDGTDVHEHVCGASESPFPLAPGLEELVVVVTQTTGGATNPCAGPATAGTVKATFSNLP